MFRAKHTLRRPKGFVFQQEPVRDTPNPWYHSFLYQKVVSEYSDPIHSDPIWSEPKLRVTFWVPVVRLVRSVKKDMRE